RGERAARANDYARDGEDEQERYRRRPGEASSDRRRKRRDPDGQSEGHAEKVPEDVGITEDAERPLHRIGGPLHGVQTETLNDRVNERDNRRAGKPFGQKREVAR